MACWTALAHGQEHVRRALRPHAVELLKLERRLRAGGGAAGVGVGEEELVGQRDGRLGSASAATFWATQAETAGALLGSMDTTTGLSVDSVSLAASTGAGS